MKEIDPAAWGHIKFDWNGYTCFHFVRDVWKDTTGVDMGVFFPKDNTVRAWSRAFKENSGKVIGHLIQEIDEPEDQCLVLFTNRTMMPHCGVMVHGKVLHLHKGGKVEYEDFDQVLTDCEVINTRFFK